MRRPPDMYGEWDMESMIESLDNEIMVIEEDISRLSFRTGARVEAEQNEAPQNPSCRRPNHTDPRWEQSRSSNYEPHSPS